jgi:AcrR family transcriptional regulator
MAQPVATGEGVPPGTGVPPLSRIERKRLRRVNEILRVAAEVVAERGYQNASLDEVADRLDLAKASLYHYFESKQALVSACLDTGAAQVASRLDEIVREGGTATDTLRRLIIEQLTYTTQDHPELSRLFLRHLEWPAPLLEQIHRWLVRHDQIWKEVIQQGIAAGEFEVAADPAVVRHCIHGALDFVPFWYRPDGTCPAPDFYAAVAGTVLLMVGVKPGADLNPASASAAGTS